MTWKIFDLDIPDEYTLEYLLFNPEVLVSIMWANHVEVLPPVEDPFSSEEEEEEELACIDQLLEISEDIDTAMYILAKRSGQGDFGFI